MYDQPIAELIRAIAGDAPAPGSGAAGALALALGAACAAKAFRVSAAADGGPTALAAAAERAEALALTALRGGQRDAELFPSVLGGAPESRPISALQNVGEALLAIAEELRVLVCEHRNHVKPSLRPDLDACLTLADAGDAIQEANVAALARTRAS